MSCEYGIGEIKTQFLLLMFGDMTHKGFTCALTGIINIPLCIHDL
ncbi:hypothetical protein SCARR_05453 [Pontiella sulfatireligans]|uniref:Uncharacterized protein n=1 Tax=Pontiella sulfatireligans TaxID=2750658 RepID=A0A6C2UWX0_9BACT|nr:hypothetical protein SCARR_05453 [Pontiella sulfatireligans]